MIGYGSITFLIIFITGIVSYKGFKNQWFLDKYEFDVEKILVYKDYKRLFTSGFLHINWLHLIMNMISLYFFSGVVEGQLGIFVFLFIYVASLVGGNLFSLLVHKHDNGYSALGASGAVSGILFASIALFPDMGISLFFLPAIPSWIYGLAYTLYSIYGIKSRANNVGHDAHLAGGLIGMLVALALQPSSLSQHPIIISLIAVPSIVFVYIIITRPQVLLIDDYFFKKRSRHYTIDQRYNAKKVDKQKELDRLLEKIHTKGMSSLSTKEKKNLAEYSKSVL